MELTKKQRQVGILIQKEFSTILQVDGPFIYGSEPMLTVTNARMSGDLGIAYIYISVYNAPYKQEVIKLLWENMPYLRGLLGKRIGKQVRRVPNIKFFIDDTLDESEHIEKLFTKINTQQNLQTRSMKEAMEDRKKLELFDKVNASKEEE